MATSLEPVVVKGRGVVVSVEEKVDVRVGDREGQGIRQAVEEGSLLSPTVGVTCNNTGRPGVNSDEHSKVAAIRIRGQHSTLAEGITPEKDANTTVGGEGLRSRVTVLGSPKGLVTPLSSPCSLFSFGAALGFKEAQYIDAGVAEVGTTKRGISEATGVVEAEADLSL